MLLADDFVGVSDSGEELQKLIDVVHAYWKLKANVSKSAVRKPIRVIHCNLP